MPAAPIPEHEVQRLADLHSFELIGTGAEQGYDDVTFLASYICETPVSLITLVDRDWQYFKSSVGVDVNRTTRAESFCSHLIGDAKPLFISDATEDPRFIDNPLVNGPMGIRFYGGVPLVTPAGHVIGSVCVIDDKPRTLRPQQVQALEALARQVMARMELHRRMLEEQHSAEALRTAEKLAAVGRMASAVAHEINNPLQSVTNLLFMLDNAKDPAERCHFMAMAQDELARVTHIVTQSLRFHQQSTGAQPVRLGELAEGVLLLYRTRLSHAGAEVLLRDTQIAPLLCYTDDVRQVLAHLLANALDALAGKRGGKLHVRIYNGSHNGQSGLRMTIADSGTGIPPEIRARLFQPFNTTKGIRGTGLGLWVSRGVLNKHGANIHIRSRVGTGTAVRLFFPTHPLEVLPDDRASTTNEQRPSS